MTPYLKALKSCIEFLDVGAFLETLENLKSWCKYRNECTHAVMSKNMDNLDSEIAVYVEKGMHLARWIDG